MKLIFGIKMKSWRNWWKQYRYRFVPWLAINLKHRSVRAVEKQSEDKIIQDSDVITNLEKLFVALFDDQPQSLFIREYLAKTVASGRQKCTQHSRNTRQEASDRLPADVIHRRALHVMLQTFGFCIDKGPSSIPEGGTGVVLTKGTISKHTVVAMYPGLIYYPYEPILLQSIANPFIFRCIDGVLIDGNDKALSKFIYRSCAGRDRLGPFELCDKTWLTPHPKNPLAIGQYVNNHNKENPANVCYQECDLPDDFPLHLRQFVPNVFYRTPDTKRCVRMVALVSLRDITEGEELFSSYFTILH